jgi:hypothetical protein
MSITSIGHNTDQRLEFYAVDDASQDVVQMWDARNAPGDIPWGVQRMGLRGLRPVSVAAGYSGTEYGQALFVFVAAADGSVSVKRQVGPNGSWTDWQNIFQTTPSIRFLAVAGEDTWVTGQKRRMQLFVGDNLPNAPPVIIAYEFGDQQNSTPTFVAQEPVHLPNHVAGIKQMICATTGERGQSCYKLFVLDTSGNVWVIGENINPSWTWQGSRWVQCGAGAGHTYTYIAAKLDLAAGIRLFALDDSGRPLELSPPNYWTGPVIDYSDNLQPLAARMAVGMRRLPDSSTHLSLVIIDKDGYVRRRQVPREPTRPWTSDKRLYLGPAAHIAVGTMSPGNTKLPGAEMTIFWWNRATREPGSGVGDNPCAYNSCSGGQPCSCPQGTTCLTAKNSSGQICTIGCACTGGA